MHEQWKKRKMFSNREQGIMSGLDPVPMMAGGSVPYPGMQVGGVVPQPQLFEEGDTEVNDALNMMASVAKPDVPDMPMPMMDEKVEVREEVTEDQGPDEYKQDVLNLKDKFKQEIMTYMSQGQTPELRDYLMNMNMTYANELEMLKEKHGVEMNDPDDKLMTPDFVEQLMTFAKAPGMEKGGVALPGIDLENISSQEELNALGLPYTIDAWLTMTEEGRRVAFLQESVKKAGANQIDPSKLEGLYKERRDLVDELGTSAGTAYKTKEGGLGGYIGQALAERRGKAAAMDKILADEIANERTASGTGAYKSPASVIESIVGSKDPVERQFEENKKLFKDDENPTDSAIAELALNGIAPPSSAGPIFGTVLTTPGGDKTFLEFYKDQLARLPTNDREARAGIIAAWRLAIRS